MIRRDPVLISTDHIECCADDARNCRHVLVRTASEVHELACGARLSADDRRRTVALQGDQPRSDLPADKLADVEWLDGFIREWNDAAEREDAGEDEDDA